MVTGAESGRIVWKGPQKVSSPTYCSKPLLIGLELQCFVVTTSMVAVDCCKPNQLFGEQQIKLVNDRHVCTEASLK